MDERKVLALPRGDSSPAGTVRVRYLGPPSEGVHPLVGGVQAREIYEVAAATAEALVRSGEFELAE